MNWTGLVVPTPQAKWVCTKSNSKAVGFTGPNTIMVDGIDYFLEFMAVNKVSAEVPDSRTLQLRSSEYLVAAEPHFIQLVIEGQMIETDPWNRYFEIHKKD